MEAAAAIVLVVLVLAAIGANFGVACLGARIGQAHGQGYAGSVGPIRSVLFALFGLISAFAFNSATQSFDNRRASMLEEGIAIRTAYRRVQTLQDPQYRALEPLLVSYADLRRQSFRHTRTEESLANVHAATDREIRALWEAGKRLAESDANAGIAVQGALLDMLQARNRQMAISAAHAPGLSLVALGLLGLVCAYYVGYGIGGDRKRVQRGHLLAYSCTIGMLFYLILDFELPQLGFLHNVGPDFLYDLPVEDSSP